MNGSLCLGRAGSHVLKQRNKVGLFFFVFFPAAARLQTSRQMCTVYASHYRGGGNEPLTLFPAATHAPIGETSIRHGAEAGV